jgi:hypothetical protein
MLSLCFSTGFLQNNPRRIPRIRPPLVQRLVGPDYSLSSWLVTAVAIGQLLPVSECQ